MNSYVMKLQMNATERHFPTVLLVTLKKRIVTFGCENEIVNCDHSDERYAVVLSWGGSAVYYAVGAKLFYLLTSVDEIVSVTHSGE